MARINAKGLLSGTVGNYSFKVVDGKGIVRSKPRKGGVRQTAATKSSASEFGNAHALAKKIRTVQFPVLHDLSDSRMYNRFATAIYKTILSASYLPKGKRTLLDGNLETLDHFQFNANSTFSRYCQVPIAATLNAENKIQLTVDTFDPRKDIATVEVASEAKLAFLVTVFQPEEGTESHAELFQFTFDLTKTATTPQQWISGVLPAGHIAFVSVALFYYRKNSLAGAVSLNNKKMHPSEIVKVFAL